MAFLNFVGSTLRSRLPRTWAVGCGRFEAALTHTEEEAERELAKLTADQRKKLQQSSEKSAEATQVRGSSRRTNSGRSEELGQDSETSISVNTVWGMNYTRQVKTNIVVLHPNCPS